METTPIACCLLFLQRVKENYSGTLWRTSVPFPRQSCFGEEMCCKRSNLFYLQMVFPSVCNFSGIKEQTVSHGLAKVSACCFHICLTCSILSQTMPPVRLVLLSIVSPIVFLTVYLRNVLLHAIQELKCTYLFKETTDLQCCQ